MTGKGEIEAPVGAFWWSFLTPDEQREWLLARRDHRALKQAAHRAFVHYNGIRQRGHLRYRRATEPAAGDTLDSAVG